MPETKPTLKVGGKRIGSGSPVYLIAEIGINHNGSLDLARRLIDVAVDAGCDCVKFQKRTPEKCVSEKMKRTFRETPWGTMSYLDYRRRIEFGAADYRKIDSYCRTKRIPWTCSVWDLMSADFLESFDPPFVKIPSACLVDHALLKRVQRTGRVVFLSTGMSTLEEIRSAVEVLGTSKLVILHCKSCYPLDPRDANLRMIATLQREFPCVVGYSGHETGIQVSVAASVLGAAVIERHITLDRSLWGSDQAASLEPQGLNRLVRDVRICEAAMGDGIERIVPAEQETMKRLRVKTK